MDCVSSKSTVHFFFNSDKRFVLQKKLAACSVVKWSLVCNHLLLNNRFANLMEKQIGLVAMAKLTFIHSIISTALRISYNQLGSEIIFQMLFRCDLWIVNFNFG